jgi:hypothetical protein
MYSRKLFTELLGDTLDSRTVDEYVDEEYKPRKPKRIQIGKPRTKMLIQRKFGNY